MQNDTKLKTVLTPSQTTTKPKIQPALFCEWMKCKCSVSTTANLYYWPQ